VALVIVIVIVKFGGLRVALVIVIVKFGGQVWRW
jgi:hypothetical protein